MIECDFGEIVYLLEHLSFICYNPSNIGGLTPPFHQRTSHVRLTTFPNVETGARNLGGLPDVGNVGQTYVGYVKRTQRT